MSARGISAGEAVELNHVESVRLEGRLPWVKLSDDGDVLRLFAGDTWPANTVCNAHFRSAVAGQRVKEVLEPHLEAKVACNWVIGPASEPAELTRHLSAHGFSCRIHCAGMACELKSLASKPELPKGVTVECLNEPPSLLPLTTERRRNAHKALLLQAKADPRHLWHFVAKKDEKPIGQTTLILGAGVAGIYGVNVLESFRGQGIGTGLVHAALGQAKKLGFSRAVLSATGMGKGVYERVGFKEVCRISFWKYGKMRQLWGT